MYECLDKFVQPVDIDDYKTDKHGVQVRSELNCSQSGSHASAQLADSA